MPAKEQAASEWRFHTRDALGEEVGVYEDKIPDNQ